MSQPRYPSRAELAEAIPRSPRRSILGLSLLASVVLAPKCGAMPYRSVDPDQYRTDQTTKVEPAPDLNRQNSDIVELAGDLPAQEDLLLDGEVDESLDGLPEEVATDSTGETSR